MKISADEKKPSGKKHESRTDQAREVVEEYADDLRAVIESLRRKLSRRKHKAPCARLDTPRQ